LSVALIQTDGRLDLFLGDAELRERWPCRLASLRQLAEDIPESRHARTRLVYRVPERNPPCTAGSSFL